MPSLPLASILRVLLAAAVAIGILACDPPDPARPVAAELQRLGQLAVEAHDHAAELRLRHWASAGIPAARRELGRVWLTRDGMQRDAFHQYELAARDGDAAAALVMGNWLRNSPQAEKAVVWYRLAAERGEASAALALGQMAMAGEGMAADLGLAMHWLQRAAQMGDPEARSLVSLDRV